jgi:glutamate racemase
MKAGVFDSGVGGLTVVKSLLDSQIFKEIVYYGDTARVPYGTKDKNTIIRYSLEALEYFENHDIDILIIACNSASAHALNELKSIAKIPVVGVIDSGILAVNSKIANKNQNILVIGTTATINSNLYEIGLRDDGFKNIISKATPLFVPLVEENVVDGEILDATLKYYFQDIKDIDVVILGCTHFPLLQDKISKYLNNAITIHSGDAIVEFLRKEFNFIKKYKNTTISFFASSNPDGLKQIAQKWLKEV